MEWKRVILVSGLLCLAALSGCSKAADDWLRLLGDPAEDVAEAVVTDAQGNIYLAGHTSSNRDGGSAPGGSDVLVAKFSASGDLQWETRWNAPKMEQARALALSKDGIFVAGYTSAPLEADPNKKDEQILLMKLKSNGEIEWTREYGETGDIGNNAIQESGEAVAVDSEGALYLAGFTVNSFGKSVSQTFDSDGFVLKLDGTGEIIDQELFSTPRNEAVRGVHVNDDGTVVTLTGETSGSLGNNQGQKNAQKGFADAFVIRMAEEGGWIRLLGTKGEDKSQGLAVDSEGNIFIGGTVGEGLPNLEGYGSTDGFVASFDSAGNLRWQNLLGGPSMDQTNGIAFDEETNSIYATGLTWSEMSKPKSTKSLGQGNVYVARLNAENGQFVRHVQQITKDHTDWGRALSVTPFGIVTVGFAGGSLGQEKHQGSTDILLWKLNRDRFEPKD